MSDQVSSTSAARRAEEAAAPVPGRAGSLDGLRALAVVCVFLFHGGYASDWVRDNLIQYVVHLDIGVEIFFVLSGFLIYRQFAAANVRRTPSPGLGTYALRRFLRIYPAYWLALAVLAALGWITFTGTTDVVKHATLTFMYFDGLSDSGIAPAWTLCVEVSFYAFVPLWAFTTRFAARRAAAPWMVELAGAVALGLLGCLAVFLRWHQEVPLALRVLPPAMSSLAAGMVLAIISVTIERSEDARARISRVVGPAGLWWLAAVALFVVLAELSFGFIFAMPGQRIRQDLLQSLIAALLVTPVILAPRSGGGVRRTLASPAVAYIGLVSYGIFLWHSDIIEQLNPTHVSVAAAAAALAGLFLVTTAVASVSWFGLERPLLRFAHRTRGFTARTALGTPAPSSPPSRPPRAR